MLVTLTEPIVFVVDDDAAVRAAIKNLLESAGIRAEIFCSPSDFLTRKPVDVPGCLVLDVRFPGMSGMDFQRELAAAKNAIPIIFITAHGDIPMTVQAMKAGAVDFLSKPFRDQDLLDAIYQAVSRDRQARAQKEEVAKLRRHFEELTPREREVMTLVIKGLLNKQIASQLGTSETTIKIQRRQVMQKMEASSLPDLVRMAEKLCIIASAPDC
jgi:RNA polymerase sigma factor (sigma-70 family)